MEVDSTKGDNKDVGLLKTRIRLEDGNLRVIKNTNAEEK
jgi:hypothetical protein